MSLGQPSPASPADITAAGAQAASAQLPFSEGAQAASMIGQQGPTGSLRYVQTGTGPGGVPTYTAITNLSPAQQQLLNQLQGTQTTAGGQAGSLIGGSGYGSTSPSTAIGDMTHGLVGQMMGQETSFLDPFFKTQTDQLDTKLRNQGLTPDTEAYKVAMRDNQTNQGLQVNQFLASAMPQEQQIAAQQYQMPMTMAESLAGFGAPQSPTTGFTGSLPGMQAPSVTAGMGALQQQSALDYQAKQAQYNAMMGGLFGAGSNVLQGMMLA